MSARSCRSSPTVEGKSGNLVQGDDFPPGQVIDIALSVSALIFLAPTRLVVAIDVAYVRSKSLALDMVILLRTVPRIVSQRGSC